MGLAWWVAGLVAFVSIAGTPWGRVCFVIGKFTFLPVDLPPGAILATSTARAAGGSGKIAAHRYASMPR
jgi:uncharacterized membrane protein YccF (DUF307 family)